MKLSIKICVHPILIPAVLVISDEDDELESFYFHSIDTTMFTCIIQLF